jgi:hypothetical protein
MSGSFNPKRARDGALGIALQRGAETVLNRNG